ncbi:MAG TPA: RluA family pseudouridine synthase [Chthoniobacterales bacterium]|nr:RluA family pseudouridine synthase [Chthoniobacterales bacterium]
MTLRSEIKPVLSASEGSGANSRPSFRIVGETDDLIVVDKPPFLLVHPSKPGHLRTLWGELKQLLAFEIANGGQVSIVNRLDRETSGLVLVAKNAVAARRLGLLMQKQRIAKEYLAVVHGWPEWQATTVDSPLVRQGAHGPSLVWLKQQIHPAGAPARTDFEVAQRFHANDGERFAIVRAVPKTGRTHQIRVHLSSLGHPIGGDKIYGRDERLYLEFIETGWTPRLQRNLLLPRHGLHSATLEIADEGRWVSDLPPDLAAFVEPSRSGSLQTADRVTSDV